ncbi:hypothetical protein [Chromobacterium alticapitis]|uniref:DUF5666 domain-containing protein n=1 Tax=Chromobacterium alticapitis TaxID=2073169 RepID=A0A2S5DIW0_9NEIS|nr:hypothetical protein [Chromobacterium alticapitis]POZ63013.1 hypothetical protein C2I19_04165 [Chromobacterium alticapitis]
MKTRILLGTAAFCLLANAAGHARPFAVHADGDTPITLRGTIIGPLSSGDKAEGTFFRAFHLKLAKPMAFDDGADCGAQSKSSLALNQDDMGKYKGQAVTVRAKVFCQLDRTGTYHLGDIVIAPR